MTILEELEMVAVERCINEVRSGRPVVVVQGDAASVIAAAENIHIGLFKRLREVASGPVRLAMAAARLRHLGFEAAGTSSIVLADTNFSRIDELITSETVEITEELSRPTALELASLDLIRFAFLLPAVVSIPIASKDQNSLAELCRVEAIAIETYRAKKSSHLKIIAETPVPLEVAGDCRFVVFRGGEGMRDQIAVVIGRPDLSLPVPVRLHSACLTGDLFSSLKCDCGDQLRGSLKFMAENGGGVILYLDQEGRGNGIANKLRAYGLQWQGHDTFEADEILGFDIDQRRFEFAASMLRQLGLKTVKLLTNNPAKIAALQQAGLTVVSSQRLNGRLNIHNREYLASKRNRAGHLIGNEILGSKINEQD
ncbi:GTP cyclohydrolase II [Rhodoligotrophos appendicifer]|uniref:GTP cyclohydrolase II RibA n=1 Tax=Rhodoligotrophos appendicifer TaxID=987056 RepID=UPI0011862637|nr:GTP cyclohydrolase II RibA [Rhodoligotrophos appendicifer]